MSKIRKTRKQKVASAQKKQAEVLYTYSQNQDGDGRISQPSVAVTTASLEQFFRYDTKLIYKDLFKTCLISFILIVSLVAISYYMR